VPFGVSGIAQEAAVASLAAAGELADRVQTLVTERERVITALAGQGWSLPQTQANFVWFATGDRTADFAATCEEAGLVVRPYGTDGVRVSIGEVAANDLLVEVAGRWLAGTASS
jgi:histidinol-phosphate aminotransferase